MFTFPLCQFGSSGSTYIKSIQRLQITIPVGATSATATISSVDTTKAVPFYNGTNTTVAGGFAGAANFAARVELTNATTVTVYRANASATDTATAAVTVVEFTSALVQSVQLSTITTGASSNATTTISSVNLTRSAIVYLGNSTSSTSSNTGYVSGVTLTNSTTVTSMGAQLSTTIITGFAVIQFQASAITSLEQRFATYNDTSLTETDTLSTSVDTSRSIILFGGIAPPSAGLPAGYSGLSLAGSNSVSIVRQVNSSNSRTYSYTVVQFASGVLKSLQRGVIVFGSSDTSVSATVSPVNMATAFVNWNCGELNGSTSAQNSILHMLTLANATTVTSSALAASFLTTNHEWELVEFT